MCSVLISAYFPFLFLFLFFTLRFGSRHVALRIASHHLDGGKEEGREGGWRVFPPAKGRDFIELNFPRPPFFDPAATSLLSKRHSETRDL